MGKACKKLGRKEEAVKYFLIAQDLNKGNKGHIERLDDDHDDDEDVQARKGF